jgi:hypothetical protein
MPSDPTDEVLLVDSPTEAHQAMLTLLYDTVVEAARRRPDELPGLVETLQDEVLLTTGGTSRLAYGWFAESAWQYGDRRVHELFVNADLRAANTLATPAEEVLVTLLHEACHVWAQATDIKDTSRDGRYHNRRFAEIALIIGLGVEKDTSIGHRTPGLSSWARIDYADLLGDLERGLILAREPLVTGWDSTSPDDEDVAVDDAAPAPSDPATATKKYIFATCQCQDAWDRHLATIRVAKGSWRVGTIYCSICQAPFTESLTNRRQQSR